MSTSGPYGSDWIRQKLSDEEAVARAVRFEELRTEALRQKRAKKFDRYSALSFWVGAFLGIIGGLSFTVSLLVMLFSIVLDKTDAVEWTPRTVALGILLFLPAMALMKFSEILTKKGKE